MQGDDDGGAGAVDLHGGRGGGRGNELEAIEFDAG